MLPALSEIGDDLPRLVTWGTGAAVVTCAACAAGLPWGILGVAVAYAIASCILLVRSLFLLVDLSLLGLVRAVRAPLTDALLMAGLVAMIRVSCSPPNSAPGRFSWLAS
jgi:hypothetical protein